MLNSKQTDKITQVQLTYKMKWKKQKKGSFVVPDNKIQGQVKILPLQGGADLALTAKIASVKVNFFKDRQCQGNFFQRLQVSRYIFSKIASVKVHFFQTLPVLMYSFSKISSVKLQFFLNK